MSAAKPMNLPPVKMCYLQGEPLRELPALKACGSGRRVVYACQLHGECLPHVSAEGVRACFQCLDRMPIVLPARTYFRWITEGLGI